MGELRVASINLHMGVPEGMHLDPSNERVEALHDVAAFLRDQDVDVALLQEVRDDAPGARPGGVPHQLRVLGEAANATCVEFHATVSSDAGDRYGIAILTRNGVQLLQAFGARLPFQGVNEPRAMLFAQVATGDSYVTVANLHLDHTGMDRRGQLAEVDRILHALIDNQVVRAADARHDYHLLGPYLGPLIVGGDFNDAEHAVAAALGGTGLVNVIGGLAPNDPLRADTHVLGGRIDHLLLSRELVLEHQHLGAVPRRELTEGTAVTDHLAIVARITTPDIGRESMATSAAAGRDERT